MKKSRIGKLSIILILIATLFVSAAIAIFGLSTNKGTGANGLSTEISAPDKDASSAIAGGEETDDGTIKAPEIEAAAMADYSGALTASRFTNMTTGSTYTVTQDSFIAPTTSGSTATPAVLRVAAGKTIYLCINPGVTVTLYSQAYFNVLGTLYVYGGGTISAEISSRYPAFQVGSTSGSSSATPPALYLGYNGTGVTLSGRTASSPQAVNLNRGSFTMSAGEISGFRSSVGTGGAVTVMSSGSSNIPSFTMTGGTIRGNQTNGTGGAVFVVGGATFTMSGGTIGGTADTDANTADDYGGGVYLNGGTFEMSGGTISNNSATNGGGVYIAGGGIFSMSGGTISNNKATVSGGGVCVGGSGGGTFTMSDGAISENKQTSTNSSNGYGGGGVYVGGMSTGNTYKFTMTGGTISGNTASQYGGGVCVVGYATSSAVATSIFTMDGDWNKRGTISGNTATNGGGVLVDGWVGSGYTNTATTGTFNKLCGDVNENNATDGGGIFVSSYGSVYMESGTLNNNTATRNGGGACVNDGKLDIYYFITNNTAVDGGGVYIYRGKVLVSDDGDPNINKNTATGNGGGVYLKDGTFEMTGGNIGKEDNGNKAVNGGGAYIEGGTFTMSQPYGSIIQYNTATGNGGGVYLAGGTLNASAYNGNICNNTANNGGGVYYNAGTFNLHGFDVHDNIATTNGGGVYVGTSMSLSPSSASAIYKNSAGYYGGGVYVASGSSSSFELVSGFNLTIHSNSARNGGGVYCAGTFNMRGGDIYKNSASEQGGGVYQNGGTFNMSGGTIGGSSNNKNTAAQDGGGVRLANGTFNMTGGTISYNEATTGYSGGGVYMGSGTFNMEGTSSANAIIAYNKVLGNSYSNTGGGGVAVSGGTFKMTTSYSHIRNNSSVYQGGGLFVSGGTVELRNGTIGGEGYANTASRGAGLYIYSGTVTMGATSSGNGSFTISYNQSSGYGGGVYIRTGSCTMSTFAYIRYNRALYGGGAYLSGGTLSVTGTNYINDNTATNNGGGVNVAGGIVNMSSGSVHSNAADYGGGVFISSGAFNMTSGNIGNGGTGTKNTVTNLGPAIYQSGGTVTQSGGTIYYHTAATGKNGGAVYVAGGTYTLTGTSATAFGVIRNNSAINGGAVAVGHSGKFVLANYGRIYGNTATVNDSYDISGCGGGVYVYEGTFEMTGGYLGYDSSNYNSARDGGGVYLDCYSSSGATFTMSDGYIQYNRASGVGGGVYDKKYGTFTMFGGHIYYNSAYEGGGVNVSSSATFTFSDGYISDNTATDAGGGVYVVDGGTVYHYDGDIESNKATQGAGVFVGVGGVFNMYGDNDADIQDNVANGNRGNTTGGGVEIRGGTFNMYGGWIHGNSVTSHGGGGGIHLADYYDRDRKVTYTGKLTISGGYIYSNSVPTNGENGGGIRMDGGTVTMTGGYINSNTASKQGGGVYMQSGTFTMSGGYIGHTNSANGNSAPSGGGVFVDSGATFTLSGGYIMNNRSTSTNNAAGGGGVALFNGTFTMTSGYIQNNSAKDGGGLLIEGGTFEMSGGYIGNGSTYKNTATRDGGGIYMAGGQVKLSGGWIFGNDAGQNGGGIYQTGGTLTLSGVIITTNTALFSGGGMCVDGGSVTMTSGYIRSNKVTDSRGMGGGVFIDVYKEFTLSGGYIGGGSSYKNTAAFGGGVYVDNHSTFTLSNGGYINYNEATMEGGGVYLSGGTFNMTGGYVRNNSATDRGGAAYVAEDSLFTCSGGFIGSSSGISYANTAKHGAAVFVENGTFELAGGTIYYNKATYDGGAVDVESGTFTMTSGTIRNNEASRGGGVYISGGTTTVSGGYIRNNSAAEGGGVHVNGGEFELNGGYIGGGSSYANTASGGYGGGGVYVTGWGTFTLTSGSISYNRANTDNGGNGTGGGVLVTRSSSFVMDGGTVANNSATNKGGAIYATESAKIYLNGGTVGGTSSSSKNTAKDGGGVYIAFGSTLTLDGGTIAFNEASQDGGGVYLAGSSAFTMTSGYIQNNSAYSGGGVCVNSGNMTMSGGYIRNNTAGNYGGGVKFDGTTLTLSGDSYIYSNTSEYGAGGIHFKGTTFNMDGGYIGAENYGNTSGQNGGGVLAESGTFNMTAGTIAYNTADAYGGGVSVSGATFKMTGGTIENNTANEGGGVRIRTSTSTLSGGDITGNKATINNKGGGGLLVHDNGKVTLSGVTISGNEAAEGGGVRVNGSTATVTLTTGEISGNTAEWGGGVFINSGTTFTMTGGLISANTAVQGSGVYINENDDGASTFAMTGGKITENITTSTSGAVFIETADCELRLGGTAYIYGNTYSTSENNVYIYDSNEQSITFSGKLASGAKIGVFTGGTHVLTSGFTTAGHTQADIVNYFVSDIRGLTLKYQNNEVVSAYNVVSAWNDTVQASLDNSGADELFILVTSWSATNGSFGQGVGFDNGSILVPKGASILMDMRANRIDKGGASGSVIIVRGTFEIVKGGALVAKDGGTISGGNAEKGGGVYVDGGSFTLRNGRIQNNNAGQGGGVYVDNSGTFTLTGGTIGDSAQINPVSNTAENGAGVYIANGTFTLTGGTIQRNTATANGGGVYVDRGGSFEIKEDEEEGSYIQYNSAVNGAGVYVANGGSFTLTDGTISNNTASENGGGVHVNGGMFEMVGGTIGGASDSGANANTAKNGGGVYVSDGTAIVDGGTISYNTASENGAGVYVAGGKLTVSNGEISNNTATDNGGGVYVTGATTQVTLDGGTITANKSANGLGVYVESGKFTLTSGKITANTTTTADVSGGGVYVAGGTFNIEGGEISNNKVTVTAGSNAATGISGGAGVYASGGTVNMSGGTITGNTSNYRGAGLYIGSGATLNLTGGTITGNTLSSNYGGGVYVSGTFNMDGGEISNNKFHDYGGGVSLVGAGAKFTMTNGTITGNTVNATSNLYGGAVYLAANTTFELKGGEISGNTAGQGGGVYSSGTFTMSGGTITDNTANYNPGNNVYGGGGVRVAGGKFEMTGGEISNNTAVYFGGGVLSSATTIINGGIISNNTAVIGGGVSVNSGTFTVESGEISDNTATTYGGGVTISSGTFNMNGGEISGNTATTLGGGVYQSGGTFNMNGGEISGNTATTYGGGVYATGPSAKFNIIDGTIVDNTATTGGGLYIIGSATATLSGGSITENHSTDTAETAGGGGVYVKSAKLNVSGTAKITKNTAVRNGGGIYVDGSAATTSVQISDGTIGENTAVLGAGIYATGNFAKVTIGGGATISNNVASNNGGGLALFNGANVEMCNNAFVTYNEAPNYGGGAYVSDAGSTLTLSDKAAFTYNTARFGGAVTVIAGATFAMENGAISHNEASESGGAVYATSATFTMNGGEIATNTATVNGGGVYVAADSSSLFQMNGGTIGGVSDDENDAANNAVLGGGVYIAGGKATLTSGTINGNTATANGAGVYFSSGTLEVKGNPAIYDNLLDGSANDTYLCDGKLITVTGVLTNGAKIGVANTGTITAGYTSSGNGESQKDYFFGDVEGTFAAIVNSEVVLDISLENAWNNAVQTSLDKYASGKDAKVQFTLAEDWTAESGLFGASTGVGFTENGGLLVPANAYIILNLNGYTINRNLSTPIDDGSVFTVVGTLEISGAAGYITGGNTTYGYKGGGIYIDEGGVLTLTTGTIQNNTANYGGGVYVASGATFNLNGGTIRNNTLSGSEEGAKSFGAGVYVENGATFNMTSGTISGNTSDYYGGGVAVYGTFNMSGGTISDNKIIGDYHGGGVYINNGTFNMSGGEITGNKAYYGNGGGVYMNNSTFEMTDGVISGNSATNGGGVFITGSSSKFTMDGGEISGNSADNGGVYVNGGTFTLNDGKIANNDVQEGGVCVNNGTFEMNGGEISDHAIEDGGGVYLIGGTFTMNGGYIRNNTVEYSGGGVYVSIGTFIMNGGEISGNTATDGSGGGGVYVIKNSTTYNSTFIMNGGIISGNTVTDGNGGGVYVGSNSTFTMTDGSISNNKTSSDGGGVYVCDTAVFNLTGGKISNNNYGGVDVEGTFNMTGGTISGNTNSEGGGGVLVCGKFTMDGGEISGNIDDYCAGGVEVRSGTFIMNDGLISGNRAYCDLTGDTSNGNDGGGVYVSGTGSTFTMNGGKIVNNEARELGGGVYVGYHSTFTMNGGEISGNTAENGAGVYITRANTISDASKFEMTGGVITGNTATKKHGGVYVGYISVFNVSGSPMIYGNLAAGVENNVSLASNSVINVTDKLSTDGSSAYIGVTMESTGMFTNSFRASNTDPALKATTVFFSDDADYMVTEQNGEAYLTDNDYSQTALVWQYSNDGGATWINVEVPYFSVRYKAGEKYAVRALDKTGTSVAIDIKTDSTNTAIDASEFSGIGSYKFVVNSENYVNPSFTFEVLPAQIIWQYTTDAPTATDAKWFDVTEDTIVYTGATYSFRAMVYYSDKAIEVFSIYNDEAIINVGKYEFTLSDNKEFYENPTLNFEITKRYIDVQWKYSGASGNATDGYFWNYDGIAHAPVAVLNGVSGLLVGTIDLAYGYLRDGEHGSSIPSAEAGNYILTVSLSKDSPHKGNIELSNTTVEYKINPITLSLVWTDKDGNEDNGDGFTFEYNGEKHDLYAVFTGAITGDEVGAYIAYATRAGKELAEAPTNVGYYTATLKLPANCNNYVLDEVYISQIVITQKTLGVEWKPNEDGTYNWTFDGRGKGPEASIINPYTGEELNEAYKIDYAPVAPGGTVGVYTTNAPVNAGEYSVRVTLINSDGNFVLDKETATQLFTIKTLGITVTWTSDVDYAVDPDTGAYFWYYDGKDHGLEAHIYLKDVEVYKDGIVISELTDIVRTDAKTILKNVGTATATVELADNAYNANFEILEGTTQVYEVRKAVITSVVWSDALNTYEEGDTATYDFGSVKGVNGPGLEALANGTLQLVVSYNKTYEGDWVVDESVGYSAYAKLSTEDAENYAFADGAKYAEFKFFIKSVGGFKQDAEVTWVVFTNEHDYISLQEYLDMGGFVYNGNVQSPTPIIEKSNGEVEKLALNESSIGANAGKYVARMQPSSIYNIKEEQFTCAYEIMQLEIEIGWQDGRYDSNKTFKHVYDGKEYAPYAYASGTLDGESTFDLTTIVVTVKGEINAGTYTATATVSDNFKIVNNTGTQEYTISKLGIDAGKVVWNFGDASGDDKNGWYWMHDGKEHAPTATITLASLDVTLELVVTGKTSEIGTHTAYAVLNSSLEMHNNFYLNGTASTTFEITKVKAGQVYWEDESGHTYEDGKGGNTGLTFVYNGEDQLPKAYYMDGEEKHYLTVTVAGGASSGVGTYTATVSSELTFNSALPTCTFTITAMPISVEWGEDTTFTYNTKVQAPAATLSNGAQDKALVEGTDYVIVGYTNAGNYKAEIKFINTNYTYAEGYKPCDFVIEKVKLSDVTWKQDANDGYVDGNYVWTYNGEEHNPVLNDYTYTVGEGEEAITITVKFGYYGKTAEVGKHTVTAYIESAKLGEVDVKDNFTIDAKMEYVINAVTVTIDWDKDGYDEDSKTYSWEYDGNPHAPKAYLADADGNRIKDKDDNDIELKIYGDEINARDKAYTATAELPDGYALANGAKTEAKEYFITKATIEVNWEFSIYDKEAEDWKPLTADEDSYAWTYGENVTVKAYIKVTDEEDNVSNGTELTVTGFETDAGTHTLNVMQSEGNYQIKPGDEFKTYTINTKLAYVIWDEEEGYDEEAETYSWKYDGKSHAPTAYLAEMIDGELQLILDKDGEKIKVNVNGEGTEIGEHTAVAVDTFVNYHFDETKPEAYTKEFTILANELSDFKWTASKDAQVSEDGLTFTYEYGKTGVPEPTSGVKDLQFTVTIDGGTVLAITEVGTYTVTATSRDSNYQIPDGLDTITVVVTAQTIEIKWENVNEDGKVELTYNGENQMPTAYYLDATGSRIDLKVTVDGDSKDVGSDYEATAVFSNGSTNSGNYKLPENNKTSFAIVEKEITVTWQEDWAHPTYDGNEHSPASTIVIKDMTENERDSIKVIYKITKVGEEEVLAGSDKEHKGVINAGNYVITVELADKNDSGAYKNYKLGNAEFTFTIKKAELKVTANSIPNEGDEPFYYGSPIPSYSATFDNGLIDADRESEWFAKDIQEKIGEWLSCLYVPTTIPGEYTIYIDEFWLSTNLPNYKVTAVNGTLTVTAKANEVTWVGENNENLEFVYDGEATLPTAYYVDEQGKSHSLTVALAELVDGEYVVKDGEAINVGDYLAVIVDEDGNVIKGVGTYDFSNYFTPFEIVKRQITVNVKDLTYTYGELSKDMLEELLGYELAWTYGETEPVSGDVLGIEIKFTGDYDKGGYLQVGEYTVTVEWNTEFNENYDVSVKYANGDKITVDEAEITVNYYVDESGNVHDADGILSAEGYLSDFITETKKFLNIAGYEDAEITVGFKLPDGIQYYPASEIEAITEQGTVYYDFRIEIPNHKVLTGKLVVDVKASDQFLFITVEDKTFKADYGFEVPENFAQQLFAEEYAKYVKMGVVDEETFISWVTAKVEDAEGNPVTDSKLKVGSYKVYFDLIKNSENENLSIYKGNSLFVPVEISKYVIEVDWGDKDNLNYEYDGEKHMPTVTLKNVTDENGNPVTLQVGENVITVNGEQVKVTLTVDGDFTSAGGHSVLVTVEGENFEVKEDNALRSVSITEPAKEVIVPGEPVPGKTGLADWQLWVILAAAILLAAILIALVIVLVKRRKVGDDDGFYDPVDESDLQ